MVVGKLDHDADSSGFRWSADGTVVGLPLEAVDVSADGNVVVGDVDRDVFGYDAAAVWTTDAGIRPLSISGEFFGDLDVARAISADGQTIVGERIVVPNGTPVRWIGEGEGEVLFSPNGNFLVEDISADGSVIIGSVNGTYTPRGVVRWTEQTGRVDLEIPVGIQVLGADAVSADGNIIVGHASEYFETNHVIFLPHAVIWNEAQSWRRVDQMLIDSGVDLTDWTLMFARDISADGTVVVGTALNPDGDEEAFRADLSNPTLLLGDYDADQVVGQGDLDLVLLNWGMEATPLPAEWIRNLPTGRIDQDDLDAVLLNWGTIQPVAANNAIPEPASLTAALIVITMIGFAATASPREHVGGEEDEQ